MKRQRLWRHRPALPRHDGAKLAGAGQATGCRFRPPGCLLPGPGGQHLTASRHKKTACLRTPLSFSFTPSPAMPAAPKGTAPDSPRYQICHQGFSRPFTPALPG